MRQLKYKGYSGKIAFVDLSKKKISFQNVDNELAEKFIGGIGFATYFLDKYLDPKVDPLSPANIIAFMVGPLTGTIAPMTGRHVIASKSPLTNAWGQSDAGGYWGAYLKFSGFDGIIVTGASDRPVYLFCEEGSIEIKDAKDIWGLDTYETEIELKNKHGQKSKVLSIGQAGENLVKIASIINDMGRAAGRRGLGAVMGSKKLKAIVVSGEPKIEVHDFEQLKNLQRAIKEELFKQPGVKLLRDYGTGGGMDYLLKIKDLPLKNWLQDDWDINKANKISSKVFFEKGYVVGHFPCFSCPIACTKKVQIKEGKYSTSLAGKAPEYETLASLGALSLVSDIEPLIKANDLANRFGLDTITMGEMIAYLRELNEKGIDVKSNLDLSWGNGDTVIELIRLTANRKDIGNILAEGPKYVKEKLGKKVDAEIAEVKGDGIPMHDPRTYIGMGLKYAVTVYGPDHSRADAAFLYTGLEELGIPQVENPTPKDVAFACVQTENFVEVLETLVMCVFAYESWAGRLSPKWIPKLIYSVTGMKKDLNELLSIGSKLVDAKRKFNERAGLTPKDDRLPERFKKVPRFVNNVPMTIDIKDFIEEYYKLRKWK